MADECECGLTYEEFRTGLSYAAVYSTLWVDNPETSMWRYKRRHTVLGVWKAIKRLMWRDHVYLCEQWSREFKHEWRTWADGQAVERAKAAAQRRAEKNRRRRESRRREATDGARVAAARTSAAAPRSQPQRVVVGPIAR